MVCILMGFLKNMSGCDVRMKNNIIKIVALGDSITYGYPYEPELSWFKLAGKQFNMECINRGVNGDTTAGMLSRFKRDILRYKPSYVIIMGGTNDVYSDISTDEIINNISNMVELAVKYDIIPVIGLPIPCSDLQEEILLGKYREQLDRYCRDNNIETIDFYKVMVNEQDLTIKEELYLDRVHPNEAGYQAMTAIAAAFFTQVFINERVHAYYWKEDFSCIITTLKVLSEIFHVEFHPQVLEAAYGLNAGRLGSQCGLVEGALMFIGIYGQQKALTSQEITQLGRNFSSDFQQKFGSVLCKELRPQGFRPENPPHLCENITKCAVEFSVEFISKKITLPISSYIV